MWVTKILLTKAKLLANTLLTLHKTPTKGCEAKSILHIPVNESVDNLEDQESHVRLRRPQQVHEVT